MWCSVIASVMALPSPSTVGRLLLVLKSVSEATETSSSKRAKKKSSYNVGSLVQAEVDNFEFVCSYYLCILVLEFEITLNHEIFNLCFPDY